MDFSELISLSLLKTLDTGGDYVSEKLTTGENMKKGCDESSSCGSETTANACAVSALSTIYLFC